MKKTEVTQLVDGIRNLFAFLRTQSKVFTTAEEINKAYDNDEYIVYDFPYAFEVDDYGYYIQGNIIAIDKDYVTVFLTGEDWGKVRKMQLGEIPTESAIELFDLLND